MRDRKLAQWQGLIQESAEDKNHARLAMTERQKVRHGIGQQIRRLLWCGGGSDLRDR